MTFTSASRWLSKRHIEQFTFVNASNGFLKDDLPLWTLKIAHAVNIQLLKHTDLPRQLFWIDIPWKTYSNESSKTCEQIACAMSSWKYRSNIPNKYPHRKLKSLSQILQLVMRAPEKTQAQWWKTVKHEWKFKPCEKFAHRSCLHELPPEHPKQICAPKIEIAISNLHVWSCGPPNGTKSDGNVNVSLQRKIFCSWVTTWAQTPKIYKIRSRCDLQI